jgi:4-amino-4-deoxy-L-arabinose transferase-like glycosyltransferase
MNKWIPAFNLTIRDWSLIFLCSIPAFFYLGTPAIYIWDEAVYVNASLDMANGASWWLPVNGEYNTKPPLALWLQAIFLQFIPSAEWAVRLPSALSVTGILILLLTGLKRWGFDFWTRLLVLVAFVGHEGYIRHHIARTGDLDAVMTFFTTAYVMVALDAIQQNRWNKKHLVYFFVAVVAAFYAKSIGGWMMLAPLGIIWILSPVRTILLTFRFWVGAALAGSTCLLYYLTRELLQPGFLDLVWHSEYQRMFRNVMPWHEHGASYYFTNFVTLKTFTPWIYFLGGATIYGMVFLKDMAIRRHLLQWMILGFGYMLVITIPATKLEWYDAPAYPFFALITGTVAGSLVSTLQEQWKLMLIVPVLFVFGHKLLFIKSDIQPRHPFEYEGAILRTTEASPNTKVFMKVEVPEHQLQLDFYRKLKAGFSGQLMPVLDSVSQVGVGDQLIISQNDQHQLIADLFALDTIKIHPGLGYEIKVLAQK